MNEFLDYYEVEGKTLVAKFPPQEMENHRIERAGVGATLYAMGKILNTNAADWEKISVGGKKDLDFQVASTGKDFLVLECKASVVEDANKKTSSISKHKNHIKAKKAAQQPMRSDDTLIGAIAAIPRTDATPARIWLVDPPLSTPFGSARRFKVLARYRFYERLLRFIGRPFFLIALNTRIHALENIDNIEVLNNLPLVNINGETFGVPTSFTNARSGTMDSSIIGMVRRRENGLIFIGMDVSVIDVIAQQSHDSIMEWVSNIVVRQPVQIFVNPRDFGESNPETNRSNWQVFNFNITVSSSGLVLGMANL